MMIHHRRSIRLHGFDYSQAGMYFLTVCTRDRLCLLGDIVGGEMQLNDVGKIAQQCWLDIPIHFPQVKLDALIVMPNHIHGIIAIVGARHAVPVSNAERFGKPVLGSVPTIMRSFKSAVSKQINVFCAASGGSLWQRNYYEHIIRNETDYNRIAEYVTDNPRRWSEDSLNPNVACM